MSILVTGGMGYIGSHTVVKLLEAGREVVILDNLSNSKREVLDKIQTISGRRPEFVEGDIRDGLLLRHLFSQFNFDCVIHFAGLKAVGESVAKPLDYYDHNVVGSVQLLKVMKAYDCKKIVFSSSATVYGLNKDVPFVETHPLSTTNPYGATKLMIEDIIRDYGQSDPEFSGVLLRYFNPIGAHESGLIGEDPNDIPNNLLPYVAKVATGELDVLSVFGNDYDTPDGTGVRDYIHVEDLAIGHLKAYEYLDNHSGVEAVNLGTGNGYSVLQVVKAFEDASKKEVPYKIVDRRPGDIGTCYGGTEKAESLLGFKAKYDLNKMCQDAWRFVDNKKSREGRQATL